MGRPQVVTTNDVVARVVGAHRRRPPEPSLTDVLAAVPARDALRRAARRHRAQIAQDLRDAGLRVATVRGHGAGAARETVGAMRSDVDVVVRPLLVARFDGVEVHGRPDFLVRDHEEPSRWEVAHVRLAHEIDAEGHAQSQPTLFTI